MAEKIFSKAGGLPRVKLSHAPAGPNAFKRMVDIADRAEAGQLVAVYDKNNNPYGVAIYNPRSQIMLRIISRENPDEFLVEKFLDDRVTRAVAFRRDVLKIPEKSDAYRLVHDYADGLPGITVDVYKDQIALEFYSLGMYRLWPYIEAAFKKHFPGASFHHRASSYTQEMEGFSIKPEAAPAHKTRVTENGVQFEVDLKAGYKTGFFCDQRENRLFASTFAPGKKVIDICSYTGGFGIYAAKAGAEAVTCVELDPEACEMSKRNANINKVKIDVACADAFTYMRQMLELKRRYGLVVLDPYKLVANREERDKGIFKYRDFNRLALSLVEEGGIFVTCSCSGMVSMDEFSFIVRGAAANSGRKVQIFKKSGAGPDHPVAADYPEGEYLKAIWARVY
ncbi:MAG: class I SAM-dependent rRNA methyltransferase [Elusimicrobiales bacterium]|nr:class I SAM-dependent rRNA methyltransferase [Elusimicrobiales bacterium]